MSHDLEETINRLWNLDTSLKPVPFGDAREKAIIEGLHALAGHFGKEIDFTCIDANGELNFFIKGASQGLGGGVRRGSGRALVPGAAPHGVSATTASVLPENNWCRINHFAAEKLLKIAGEEIFGIDGPDASPKASM